MADLEPSGTLDMSLDARNTTFKSKGVKILRNFIKDYKRGKVQMPYALVAIRFLEEYRSVKK